jgi:CubicO group peptidase (beta-lactamase class C family)
VQTPLTAPLPEVIRQPLSFQPGEGWTYGGSLDWVGLLISRISGQSLGTFMRQNIFDKVGCDDRVRFQVEEMEAKKGDVVQYAILDDTGKGLVE